MPLQPWAIGWPRAFTAGPEILGQRADSKAVPVGGGGSRFLRAAAHN